MGRLFGAVAIFGGWLCIPLGAFSALVASSFFGLAFVSGSSSDAPPPAGVYGISGPVVLMVFVAAALLSSVPFGAAMLARDPRRSVYAGAALMAATGLALAPDPLGRAFGLPLIAGAGLLLLGCFLIQQDVPAAEEPPGRAEIAPIANQADVTGTGRAGAESSTAERKGPAEAGTSATVTTAGTGAADLVADPAPDPHDLAAESAPAEAEATLDVAPDVEPEGLPDAANAIAAEGSPDAARQVDPASAAAGAVPDPTAPAGACPWCSAPILLDDEKCPSCGAALDDSATADVEIPGVTQVADAWRAYDESFKKRKQRRGVLSVLLESETETDQGPIAAEDRDALKPPSAEVRREMARIQLEIEAGLLSPDGTAPSSDAILEPAVAAEPAPEPPVAAETAAAAEPAPEPPVAAEPAVAAETGAAAEPSPTSPTTRRRKPRA